jgi:hypothetical protein
MLDRLIEAIEYRYYVYKMNHALRKGRKARGMEATYWFNQYCHYHTEVIDIITDREL